MNYLRIYDSSKGGSVDLHPLHGIDEMPNNSEAARVMADHGYHIELLPTLPESEIQAREQWLWDVASSKNPDVRINGVIIGDIKTPGVNTKIRQQIINRCISTCAKQRVAIAIINLMDRAYAVHDIKKGVIGALQPDRNRSIKEVWIITTSRSLFRVPRRIVFDETIYDELGQL